MSAVRPRHDDHWAIIVGIDQYAHVQPDLTAAVADAANFRAWLTDPNGGNVPDDKEHILTCEASDRTQPTLWEISDLFVKLAKRASNGDQAIGKRLYVYMAGHGVGDTLDDASLLAANHHTERDEAHIAATKYADVFAEAGLFEEIIVIMDCCRDALNLREPWIRLRRKPDAQAGARSRRLYGFATGLGLKAREKEIDGKVRGIFTTALLEALRQPGRIDSQTLVKFVEKRVEKLRDEFSLQEAKFPIREDIVLVDDGQDARVTVRITLRESGDDFQLFPGNDTQMALDVERKAISPGVWEVRLQPSKLYKAQTTGEPARTELFEVAYENVDVSL